MFINRDRAVMIMADLTRQVRALIQTNREQLTALGKATPEALEDLAREDAEAERAFEMVQRVATGNAFPDERRQFEQQLVHMTEAERLRGLARPGVLN